MAPKKQPRKDAAQHAHDVFLQSIGEKPKSEPPAPAEKDAAAVALGSKGGKARASKLTAEQRSEIAKRAADARWKSK